MVQMGYWEYGQDGHPYYFMMPEWQQFFNNQYAAIDMLRNFSDKKWT